MKTGDWIRSKKSPNIGGQISRFEHPHYVIAIAPNGDTLTFVKTAIERGRPIITSDKIEALADPQPVPDPWTADAGVLFWRSKFIEVFRKTNVRDLYPTGASLRQFMGYCLFLNWLQKPTLT